MLVSELVCPLLILKNIQKEIKMCTKDRKRLVQKMGKWEPYRKFSLFFLMYLAVYLSLKVLFHNEKYLKRRTNISHFNNLLILFHWK